MKILKRKYKFLGNNVTPDSLCGNKFYKKNTLTVSKYLSAMKIISRMRNFLKLKKEGKLPEHLMRRELPIKARKSDEQSND